MSPNSCDARKLDLVGLFYRGFGGDNDAIVEFDAKYGDYFLGIIRSKMRRRIRTVFDAREFLQDFYLEIFAKDNEKLIARDPERQWYLLQVIAERMVLQAQRKWLRTAKRDLLRECHLRRLPEAWGEKAAGNGADLGKN